MVRPNGGVVYEITDTGRAKDDPHRTYITFEWWQAQDEEGKTFRVYRQQIYADMWKELDWLHPRVERIVSWVSAWKGDATKFMFSDNWVSIRHPKLGNTMLSNHIRNIAHCADTTVRELVRLAKSSDVRERVRFVEEVRDRSGSIELDSYPMEMTRGELRRRWRHHKVF